MPSYAFFCVMTKSRIIIHMFPVTFKLGQFRRCFAHRTIFYILKSYYNISYLMTAYLDTPKRTIHHSIFFAPILKIIKRNIKNYRSFSLSPNKIHRYNNKPGFGTTIFSEWSSKWTIEGVSSGMEIWVTVDFFEAGGGAGARFFFPNELE